MESEREEMLKQLNDHLALLRSGFYGQREATEKALEWALDQLTRRAVNHPTGEE